jgi:hypothetical protein
LKDEPISIKFLVQRKRRFPVDFKTKEETKREHLFGTGRLAARFKRRVMRKSKMSKAGDQPDIEAILSRRHDNGADFWSTKDGRIYVGNPFSTISALGMLYGKRLRPF